MISVSRVLPIFVMATVCARPDPAAARIQLTYQPQPVQIVDSAGASSSPEAHSNFIPARPLAHPLQTIAGLNRHGEDIFKTPGALPYLLVGVAALAADKQTVKWFRVPEQGQDTSSFAKTFSTVGSGEVIVPAIVLMYAAGHGRERDTAKLWAAAIANATLWTQGLKLVAGKERPNQSDGAVVYHGPGSVHYSSFPSGHTAAATASAIVLGHQYPRYKTLFYATALAVGIARIEGRNHWPSDVYWGAGVGYYSGRQSLRNKDAILRWKF